MNSYLLYFSVFLSSLILTVAIERKILPMLKSKAKQPIYAEGPFWHLSKSGTPTMGGVAFVCAIIASLLFSSFALIFVFDNMRGGTSLIITLLFALGNSLIGIFDDLMKLLRNKNAGLSPMQKIILQTVLAVMFLMARQHFFDDTTSIELSFVSLDLGIIYYPMALILLLGIVNCANLTDGIDGLATSVALAVGVAFLILGQGASADTPIISASLIGGGIGFLFFNAHPARIFMGDTGSLFLGALAVGLAFSMNNPATIIFVGAVYVIEGVSVILQVAVYKLTKKRLFKMAPLHHHLEKCGLDENRICVCAVIVTLFFSALVPLLLRI